jgi:hypothetical protein
MSSAECSLLIDRFDDLSLHNSETPSQRKFEMTDTESLIDQTFEAFQEFLAEMDIIEMES